MLLEEVWRCLLRGGAPAPLLQPACCPPVCREAESPPPFVEVVGKSEEAVGKQMQAITQGISGIVEKVQQVTTGGRKSQLAMTAWQQGMGQAGCRGQPGCLWAHVGRFAAGMHDRQQQAYARSMHTW